MILQVKISDTIELIMDDEITDQRPTPEVMADYLTRLTQSAVVAWMALPTAVED